MPKGMSADVSQVVLNALDRGMTRGQISGVVGVSKRAITRISSNMKKHGMPRPPPSGAKLGRPVKLTKAQADAMIVWMAQRNHTFYVKDLVAFLKDEYRYKGCDGTIRRCLVRAGYSRKLPWHKSEMTVWNPPNYRPVFVTATKSKRAANLTAIGASNGQLVEIPTLDEDDQSQSNLEDHMISEDPQQANADHSEAQLDRSGIDPALEEQPSQHDQQSYMRGSYRPATQQAGTAANLFNYALQDPSNIVYHQLMQPAMHRPQHVDQQHLVTHDQQYDLHDANVSMPQRSDKDAASGAGVTVRKSKPRARLPRKTSLKAPPQQVEALQTELERKDAFIAQLQAELQSKYPDPQNLDQQVIMAQLNQQEQSTAVPTHTISEHSMQTQAAHHYDHFQQQY